MDLQSAKEETIVFIAVLVFTLLVPASTKDLLHKIVEHLERVCKIPYCQVLEAALDPILDIIQSIFPNRVRGSSRLTPQETADRTVAFNMSAKRRQHLQKVFKQLLGEDLGFYSGVGAEKVCDFLRVTVSTGLDFGDYNYSRHCYTSDRACNRLSKTANIAYQIALNQFLLPRQPPVLDLIEHKLDTKDNLEQARAWAKTLIQ